MQMQGNVEYTLVELTDLKKPFICKVYYNKREKFGRKYLVKSCDSVCTPEYFLNLIMVFDLINSVQPNISSYIFLVSITNKSVFILKVMSQNLKV